MQPEAFWDILGKSQVNCDELCWVRLPVTSRTEKKDNVYTQCILSNTIRTYSLQSSTTLCIRYIMLIKFFGAPFIDFHWSPCCCYFRFNFPQHHAGTPLFGTTNAPDLATLATHWLGQSAMPGCQRCLLVGSLGDFTSLRAARDSCDMNNYSLGRNAPNTQPCHTTSTKTSACLWLRLFGRSTRLNARQNCHPRWATAWTVWTVSQG